MGFYDTHRHLSSNKSFTLDSVTVLSKIVLTTIKHNSFRLIDLLSTTNNLRIPTHLGGMIIW